MKRKLIIILLALTAVLALSFGLAACNNDGEHIHEYGEWTITVPATCTSSGERRQTCECGDYISEEVFPLGHDLESHEGQSYNCETNGWKPYQTCKRDGCDYTTYELIRAHHDYENGYCIRCSKPVSDYETAEDGTYIFSGIGDLTDKDVVIPSSVKVNGKDIPVMSIGEFAFHESDVISVVIPEGVTSLGDEVFKQCHDLKKVVIPSTVTSIGGGAFEYCESLEYNVNGNGCYLGNDDNPYMVLAQLEDTSVESFEIDSRTKIIYFGSFSNCENLKSVKIPNSIIDIGNDLFSECPNLESVELPDNLTEIGICMFQGCAKLKNIKIPSTVTFIGNSAFERCESLTEIAIPLSVKSIGENAFEGSGLTEITIPLTVENIGAYAFYDCVNLENVYIWGCVEEIGDNTFSGCNSLVSVCLPSSINKICVSVLDGCSSLEYIFFDGTAEQWAEIEIDSTNAASITAENVYFRAEIRPETAGNYWYFGGDGFPAVWKY